ncbi:hypothetical protein N2152v2_004690 [Parachlorella kessleri]
MEKAGPTLEAVIIEAFRVGAQVVLTSRVPSTSKPAEQTAAKRKSWFNLELDELEGANKDLEPWKKDVFLKPWGTAARQASLQPGQPAVETVLETWVFHYQPTIMPQGPTLSRSQLSRLNPTSIYKRLVIMLRSLFCYVRVLPAYRMYRVCKRQRGSNFTIGYRVSTTLPKRPPVAAGASTSKAASSSGSSSSSRRSLQHFDFAPVDTPYGHFKVSVTYQPASKVTILEQTTSPPPLPQIIADYVGGVRPPGRLPLRHTMSASLCTALQQQQQPQQAALAAGASGAVQLRAAAVGTRSTAMAASPPWLTAGGTPQSAAGLQRQASAFTPLPRHSWSSSAMRVSPHRLVAPLQLQFAAPSGGMPHSPFDARGIPPTPYGSAPQMGPLHSPPLLRSLSTQAKGPVSGTPRSKPPLPPPRPLDLGGSGTPTAAAGAAVGPGAGRRRHAPQAQGRGTSRAPARQEQVQEEEGEGEEQGEESGSDSTGGSSARQSSAPVSIPGRSPSREGPPTARRLRSSGDLWGMHQPTDVPKPLSAPAVSHLPVPGAQPSSQERVVLEAREASLPPGPLPPIPGSQLESESSGSAASSALFPTSCSPQLPFAFTPSAQSLASYGSRGPIQEYGGHLERISPGLRRTASSAGAAAGALQQVATTSSPGSAGTSWPGQGGRGSGPLGATPPGAGRSQQQAQQQQGGRPDALVQVSPQQQHAEQPGQQRGGPGAGAGAGASRGQSPSPPHVQFSDEVAVVTGREVPTATVLARRASWLGRSSALMRKSSIEGVGYSVSPMQDPLMESVLGSSTPRQYSFNMPPTPPYAAAAVRPPGISRTSSSVSGGTPPLLTFHPAPEGGSARAPGPLQQEESDSLPFDLDPYAPGAPAPPAPSAAPPPGRGFGSPAITTPIGAGRAPSPVTDAPTGIQPQASTVAGTGLGLSSDAAVGAFVRLLQEAPPLHYQGPSMGRSPPGAWAEGVPTPITAVPVAEGVGRGAAPASGGSKGQLSVRAGLKQFELIRERLESRGVVMGAVDV